MWQRVTWPSLAAALLAAVLISTALAAGGRPPGKGPGGGETETLGNNLSVPAVFVPSLVGAPVLRVACAASPRAPGADGVAKSTDFPNYWLQKTAATWSASCSTQTSIGGVIADWGDNLTTAGSLAAGKPVRVEVGLLAPAATGLTGYTVTNLTPSLEDRLATYGTDGSSFTTTNAIGSQSTRVWDSGAKLKIEQLDANGAVSKLVLAEQPMTAEINSTGAVVYGYNWGSKGRTSTPAQGTYRLTYTTSTATTITGIADTAGKFVPTYTEHTTTLVVTLGATGGGTGGGGEGEN